MSQLSIADVPANNEEPVKCTFCCTVMNRKKHYPNLNAFCNRECFNKFRHHKTNRVHCAICDKEFYVTPARIKKNKTGRFYCSVECNHVDQRSFALPYETMLKLKSILAQRPHTEGRKTHLIAMLIIDQNLRCINCGCDDTDLLEINHKGGNGNQERMKKYNRKRKHLTFLHDIISGRRLTNDLDLRCVVCNALYRLQLKGINRHKVTYN